MPASVYLIQPKTEKTKEWFNEHIPEDAQFLGNSLAVEWRYAQDILEVMANDGLQLDIDYTIVS